MTSYHYDVAIVGAGPAGCILSYLLARSGVDTLLIERDATFVREFRGPAYQPCILEYFDQMGILDDVLSVGHSTLDHFRIKSKGDILFEMDLNRLPPPHNFAIALEQGPLLRKLIQLSSEFPNLTFLGEAQVDALLTHYGMIAGVKVTIGNETKEIRSRLVVGADGRFSTVRKCAEIPITSITQHFDVVWFDVPASEELEYELGLEMTDEGIVVVIPEEAGHLRVGWVLDKGGFQKLQEKGIETFRKAILRVKPELKRHLSDALKSFDQCSYLDVKIGRARDYAKDGLILIGDAAHIASPAGGQGNKLAIQDAVEAHPAIVKALKQHKGTLRRYQFHEYEKVRQKETNKIFRWQRLIGSMFLRRPSPLVKRLRPYIMPLMSRFAAPYMMKILGYGYRPLSVATNLFSFHSDYGQAHRYHLLPVKKVTPETDQAASISFEVPDDIKPLFRYQAGQFITLRLLEKGQLHKRCYSLSSIPQDDELRITVKRVRNGLISNALIDQVEVGAKLLVLPPAGQFVLPRENSDTCMIAGGSGITPILSLIRALLSRTQEHRIHLIYANSDESSIIFKETLDALAEAHPSRFTITHNLSDRDGRLDAERLQAMIDFEKRTTHYFLCGPAGLNELSRDVLHKQGIDDTFIHSETFTSLAEPFESLTKDETPPLYVGKSSETKAKKGARVSLSLKNKSYSICCTPDESILDAALREGLDPPFSCREGICSACLARLTSGEVVMKKHHALSKSDAKKGHILTCQAKPVSKTCAIEYP